MFRHGTPIFVQRDNMDSSIFILVSIGALLLLVFILLKSLNTDSSGNDGASTRDDGKSHFVLSVDFSAVPERFVVFNLEPPGLDPGLIISLAAHRS
jgi:hypothetical protein